MLYPFKAYNFTLIRIRTTLYYRLQCLYQIFFFTYFNESGMIMKSQFAQSASYLNSKIHKIGILKKNNANFKRIKLTNNDSCNFFFWTIVLNSLNK